MFSYGELGTPRPSSIPSGKSGTEWPRRARKVEFDGLCLNMCILLFSTELHICYCRLCEAVVLSNSHSSLCFSQAILQFLRFVGMTFVGYSGPEEQGSVIKCILLVFTISAQEWRESQISSM